MARRCSCSAYALLTLCLSVLCETASSFSDFCSEDQEDTEAFSMATADQLLELICHWIEEREHFADNLRKLAEELESLRQKCNVAECVGSTLKVFDAASMIGVGVATLFTFGAAAPLMGLACINTGEVVCRCTKSIESFLSCNIMKKVQEIEKKSNEIAEKIQQILSEKKEVNPSAEPDDLEHHIMAEILRAILRQSGLNVQITNDSMTNDTLLDFVICTSDMHSRGGSGVGSSSAGVGRRSERHLGDWKSTFNSTDPQMNKTFPEVLTRSLLLSAVVILSATLIVIRSYRKRPIKLSGRVLKLFRSSGFPTSLIGGVMVFGGTCLMAYALPEMIDNWTKMIEGNHVTEASQSLRDTADKTQNTIQILKEQIKTLRKIFQEIKRKLQKTKEIEQEQQKTKEIEEEESSEEETEDPSALNVGLLNVRSILKQDEKRIKIKNVITENNLHVFLMTETWLKDNTAFKCLKEASPPEFDFKYKCRDVNKRGGGVSIQFLMKLCPQIIPFDYINSLKTTTFEHVATDLRHDEWDEGVLFINVYRPPNPKQFEKFVEEFQTLLIEACKRYKSIIVAGDFNVHVELTDNPQTILFNMAHYQCDFVQHVGKRTHKDNGTLDLVFSRNVEVFKVKTQDDDISDHRTVYFSIRPKTEANQKQK